MAIFYVYTTYDIYNPKTGYFQTKLGCVEWNTDLFGEYYGNKYASKEECILNNAVFGASQPSITDNYNTNCGIYIVGADVIQKLEDSIEVDVALPEYYCNTYLQYQLYDENNNLIKDWDYVIDKVKWDGCGSGSESGSESGKESGYQQSGGLGSGSSGDDCEFSGGNILFDRRSWNDLSSAAEFDAAATAWENYIKFDPCVVKALQDQNPDWQGIVLTVEASDLGVGMPPVVTSVTDAILLDSGKINTLSFTLIYNTSPSSWPSPKVLTHEFGHALGIGPFTMNNGYWIDGSQYPLTQNAYNTQAGVIRNKIPIDDSGGGWMGDPNLGTGSHWEGSNRTEDGINYPGIQDLMIGSSSAWDYSISSVSINYLLDRGYVSS